MLRPGGRPTPRPTNAWGKRTGSQCRNGYPAPGLHKPAREMFCGGIFPGRLSTKKNLLKQDLDDLPSDNRPTPRPTNAWGKRTGSQCRNGYPAPGLHKPAREILCGGIFPGRLSTKKNILKQDLDDLPSGGRPAPRPRNAGGKTHRLAIPKRLSRTGASQTRAGDVLRRTRLHHNRDLGFYLRNTAARITDKGSAPLLRYTPTRFSLHKEEEKVEKQRHSFSRDASPSACLDESFSDWDLVDFLNSLTPFPKLRISSGILALPNSSTITRTTITICQGPNAPSIIEFIFSVRFYIQTNILFFPRPPKKKRREIRFCTRRRLDPPPTIRVRNTLHRPCPGRGQRRAKVSTATTPLRAREPYTEICATSVSTDTLRTERGSTPSSEATGTPSTR